MPTIEIDSPAEAAAVSAPAPYHVPNADGVFETHERIPLGGMPVKCAGELYIAAAGAEEFYVGWFLKMTQPANTSWELPRRRPPCFATRTAALTWLIDEIAAKFFSDHKVARARLASWRSTVLAPKEAEAAAVVSVPPAAPVAAAAVVAPKMPAAVGSAFGVIPVEEIEPNPANPRREFDAEELRELADSIAAQGGLLQPIAVRDMGVEAKPRYRLIAGERRWRAHQLLTWEMIEAKVFSGMDEARAAELALIENLQRSQLNPMEEAMGFVELRDAYGYDVAKIHERTGKAASTIYNAFRLAELPEEVRALVRAGKLAVTKAIALGASARWGHRAAHACALADYFVRTGATLIEVQACVGDRVAAPAVEALGEAKLAVEITTYRDQLEPDNFRERGKRDPGSEIVEDHGGRLWHLAPAQWKEEKAEIDRLTKQKEDADAAKAATRAKTALAERVNVRTEDLTRGHLSYVPLIGADARYTAHLPAEVVAEGLDSAENEIVVCLKPDALKALKVREAELIAADTAAKLPALVERAVATVKRLKKIGGRELALVIAVADAGGGSFDGKAFSLLGVMPPEDEIDREEMARMDPLDLVKVRVVSALLNTKGGQLYALLRWVLGMVMIEDLGLAEESETLRERILAAAACEVFPPVELDPAKLAEWTRAHALGMPLAEIARSYQVTEADVRGALGLGNTKAQPDAQNL